MRMEFSKVLWNNSREPPIRILNFHQLKNLQIVVVNFLGQRERTNVNDIDVWVFNIEQPCNLGIFSLLVLFQCHPLVLRDRKGVDVDLNPSARFDRWPLLLEFLLHLSPNLELVLSQIFQLLPSLGL